MKRGPWFQEISVAALAAADVEISTSFRGSQLRSIWPLRPLTYRSSGVLMRIVQWSKVDARWYLGVLCRKCEAPILFALDHSEGEAKPARAEKLLLTCSRAECGHKDRKSTRLNSSHLVISYAVFCLKKKKRQKTTY